MAITDLTNTKWLLNSTINTSPEGWRLDEDTGLSVAYNFDFKINNIQCNYILFYDLDLGAGDSICYSTDGDSFVVYRIRSGWTDESYRTIEITGGTDATNTKLISWLEANGTLEKTVEPVVQIKPFLKGIADAIRNKKGTSATINAQNFASEIESIESGSEELTTYSGTIQLEWNSGYAWTKMKFDTPPTSEGDYDYFASQNSTLYAREGHRISSGTFSSKSVVYIWGTNPRIRFGSRTSGNTFTDFYVNGSIEYSSASKCIVSGGINTSNLNVYLHMASNN